MKMNISAALLLSACLFLSCGEKSGGDKVKTALAAPSGLKVERVGEENNVILSWSDNSDGEESFTVSLRDPENVTNTKEIGSCPAGSTSYTVENVLTAGKSWYLGVRADASDKAYSSKTEWVMYYLEDLSGRPGVELRSEFTATSACVALNYGFVNTDGVKKQEWGLCWSADGTPTVEGAHARGPEVPADGSDIMQVIPNVTMEYGKDYRVRAYLTISSGTYYSGEVTVRLAEEPAEIKLDWVRQDCKSLPDGVELYKTTSALEGHSFQAWYAVADPAKVSFKVNVPSSAQTVDAQFTDDCLVLVNGGYFYNGRHTGLAVIGGTPQGTVPSVRGSLRTSDPEYNVMYNVTRGAFGVDADGKPAVYWAGTVSAGSPLYFDAPMASLRGEARYPEVSTTCPEPAASWKPAYALSAGPVLLKNGRCPLDFVETAKGREYYLSNYEIIPYDIYGTSVSPDRTAAGYTADGKIVLFVCDGRVSISGGATLTQLARILRGIGCVEAVNFDGGGSTSMVVKGEGHVNDLTHSQTPANRPVVSTIGFYKK